jgi:tRNA(fMet)-specific endonuclease VapC
MAVILDSDLLSILQRRSEPECAQLEYRLSQISDDDVFTTIVTFQEQMRGWLAVLHKARTDKRLLLAYAELQSMLRDFCHLNILPFETAALSEFKRLRRQKIRIGTMDLRIASIALAAQSTLLSRNLRDFQKVPGLIVEDWTR